MPPIGVDALEAGWTVAKIFVIVLMSLYLIFAVVIVRQVQLMTRTLSLGLEGTIRLVAYLHLLFAVVVFMASIFYL